MVQRFAIIVAILASIFGYLYHAPNSEGIAQFDRVRILNAVLKITYHIVSCILFMLFYFTLSFLFVGISRRTIWFI